MLQTCVAFVTISLQLLQVAGFHWKLIEPCLQALGVDGMPLTT